METYGVSAGTGKLLVNKNTTINHKNPQEYSQNNRQSENNTRLSNARQGKGENRRGIQLGDFRTDGRTDGISGQKNDNTITKRIFWLDNGNGKRGHSFFDSGRVSIGTKTKNAYHQPTAPCVSAIGSDKLMELNGQNSAKMNL